MGELEVLKKGSATLSDLIGGTAALGMGVGNVYYVVQTTDSDAYEFALATYSQQYADGSESIHTTIQSALNACKAARNDYVIVMPSATDYNLTAALTMSKANVHLLCPAGIRAMGSNLSAVLDQNTANTAIISVTGNNCEIAGFRFTNTAAATLLSTTGMICVPTASTGHGIHVWSNTFEITASGADNEPFINFYNGGSGNRCDIHNNVFRLVTPSTTMSYGCYLSSAYADFHHNLMVVQNGGTITWGVRMNGSGGTIRYNDFVASRAGGGLSAGAFGGAILIDTQDQSAAIGNRGAVATGTFIEGGTANTSWSDNRGGVDGGLAPVDQDLDL